MANVVVRDSQRRVPKLGLYKAKIDALIHKVHGIRVSESVRVEAKAGDGLDAAEDAAEICRSHWIIYTGSENILPWGPLATDAAQSFAQDVRDTNQAASSALAVAHHQCRMVDIYVLDAEVDQLLGS